MNGTSFRSSFGCIIAFTATKFVVLILAASLLPIATAQAAPGDLDLSFSGDGIVLTDFGGRVDDGSAVALQANGKIVLAGTTLSYDENGDYRSDFAVARFDADGSLDTSFSATASRSRISAPATSPPPGPSRSSPTAGS